LKTREATRPNKLPLLFPGAAKWKCTGIREKLLRWTNDTRLASHLSVQVQQGEIGQRELDGHWVHWQWVAACADGLEESKLRTLGEWNAINSAAGCRLFPSKPGTGSGERFDFDVIKRHYGQPRRAALGEPSYDDPIGCDFCGLLGLDIPQCECGETYCSAACRLAGWEDHASICGMAICGNQSYNRVTRLYWTNECGLDKDLEGVPIDIRKTPDYEPDVCELAASVEDACKQQ